MGTVVSGKGFSMTAVTINAPAPVSALAEITLPGWRLRAALESALVAASRDKTLPSICAVWLDIDGDTLTAVGTDRYRLAVATATGTGAPGLPAAVVINAGDVRDIVRNLPRRTVRGPQADYRVRLHAPQAPGWPEWEVFALDGVPGDPAPRVAAGECLTRQGLTFPKWRQLIPTGTESSVPAPMGFNADYLADVGKLPTPKCGPQLVPVILRGSPKATVPTLWQWDSGDGFRWDYVLMPVRLPA